MPNLTVGIRPGVGILSLLAHVEYKPWFALAEYIDNSIDSFQDNRKEIRAIDGSDAVLEVSIEVDSGNSTIRIRDNAAGIALADFPRAFRAAELPPDEGGISEFGMGMKTASCWFSPLWSVRTSALGEPIERTVTFDLSQIVDDQIEELIVDEKTVPAEDHYTVVELSKVKHTPRGTTVKKIKEHLTDIYRRFLRQNDLHLSYGTEKLAYEEPKILEAPYWNKSGEKPTTGENQRWKKPIDFDFGMGMRAHGSIGIMEVGSTKYAGLSLFRRGRVIEGSGDSKYKPPEIFGGPNSYRYQRVFGELDLEGFEVSQTKTGFKWDENQDTFLEFLRDELDQGDLPLLRMAENYRVKPAGKAKKKVADKVVASTGAVITKHGGSVIQDAHASSGSVVPPPPKKLPKRESISKRTFTTEAYGAIWTITIELATEDQEENWLTISESDEGQNRALGLSLSMSSPFMLSMVKADEEQVLEPVLRIAAGIALAEHVARQGGCECAQNVRISLNKILNDALSKS